LSEWRNPGQAQSLQRRPGFRCSLNPGYEAVHHPGEATVSIWTAFKWRAKTVAVVALVLWKDWRQKVPKSQRWENLTPDQRVERLLWVAANSIEITRKVLPTNYAKSDFEYVARNSSSAIRDHLERLALLHRGRNDKAAARAELDATREFLDHIRMRSRSATRSA